MQISAIQEKSVKLVSHHVAGEHQWKWHILQQLIEWWDIKFTCPTYSRIHWKLWVAYSKVQHLKGSFETWHVRVLRDMMIDKWCPLWYPQPMIKCCNKCLSLSLVYISYSIELTVKRCICKIDSITSFNIATQICPKRARNIWTWIQSYLNVFLYLYLPCCTYLYFHKHINISGSNYEQKNTIYYLIVN